jgi:hypothetical protein
MWPRPARPWARKRGGSMAAAAVRYRHEFITMHWRYYELNGGGSPMSRAALETYKGARAQQLLRNEARHIRTRVNEARKAPQAAGVRWPFELLQNALDAGPRYGNESVTIHLRDSADRVIFEHDGAPFSSAELAALLSGGSSKDFGSEEKTGRFGTGFLATHVLAEHTSLEGLLSIDAGLERFHLTLDRSGDEAAILENIDSCNQAILLAEPLNSADNLPSARFEYPISDDGTLALGVAAFRSSLPYLYGTRPELGDVRFSYRDGSSETWSSDDLIRKEIEGFIVDERTIHIRVGEELRTWKIIRISSCDSMTAAALVLTRPADDAWEIVIPKEADPRIYRQYPLRGSGFLPINLVLDGRFEPDQERSKVLMTDSDKQALLKGFDAAVFAVAYAFQQGWTNAHLIARASLPLSSFDPDTPGEREWWRDTLRGFAERVARLSVIDTRDGYLPAKAEEAPYADFVVPRLDEASSVEETSVDRLWPLVNEVTNLAPPVRELAVDWSEIGSGWESLGIKLSTVTVAVLGRSVQHEAAKLVQLKIDGDRLAWLARYIDVVGECWQRRGGVDPSVLEGLLPNQVGVLCTARELRRDVQVPEELKKICETTGLKVRQGLLSTDLDKAISALSLEYAEEALAKAIPGIADTDKIRAELLDYLKSELPEDADCSDANEPLQRGTAQLLGHLWRTDGESAATAAREVPLVTKSKKIAHWSSGRVMMAPVSAWNIAAQPYSQAYPSDRILDEIYETIEPDITSALNIWKMAHPDPISKATAAELNGWRLAAMIREDLDSEGVTIKGEEFGYIALLQPEIFNHVQDRDQAQALLGLVLCHVVKNDSSWRVYRSVKGTRGRESVEVSVCGALWVGDLRSRVWVPVRGEDDKPAKVAADNTTLKTLLDPSWLENNADAIEFLTECFDFDELDLRLLGIGPEVEARVRQGLARILESGGGDPTFYESLAAEIESRQRRKRDIDRSRRMGYAVQDAVRQSLEAHGLNVRLVDRGLDYEVSVPGAVETLEDVAMRFEMGPYFVEVKATSTGPARLTPLQAETAASKASHYILCVVDLRGVGEDRLDQALDTCVLVHRARDSAIGIRNDAALRYEVPPETWMTGCSISDWVESISNEPAVVAMPTEI